MSEIARFLGDETVLRPKTGAFSRYRPRILTLVVLIVVAVPTVLANFSPGDMTTLGPGTEYGWPFAWYWWMVNGKAGPNGFVLEWQVSRYSWPRLAANIAIWFVILAAPGVACDWLVRRYRLRLRWSLKTMLAAVGAIALFCAWCAAIRNSANMQDALVKEIRGRSGHVNLERWGPKWLDLVGADRFRRRIVGVGSRFDPGDEELLRRFGQLPSLRYLNLSVEQLTPNMAATLGNMPQLRILRIYDNAYTDVDVISRDCVAAIGNLAELEELRLEGMEIVSGSLRCLAGLTNLKSLSLQIRGVRELELERLERDQKLLLLAHLPALPRLESIDLRYSTVDDHDLRYLTVLPCLKSLNLTGTFVTDAGLAELGSLESLEELSIEYNVASAAGLKSLLALKRLKALHVDSYDQDYLASLVLDHGDELSILECEVDGLRRALEALRQSNSGIVIDSDTKVFEKRRQSDRRLPPTGQN